MTHLNLFQSFATAENTHFRNQLVVFRPKTRSSELPTAHKVKSYVHNFYVVTLEELRAEFKVSLPYFP